MKFLRWFGTACGLAGAALIAANVSVSGWGFVIFLGNSVPWAIVGLRRRDHALALLNAGFTAVNILGVVRWLG